MLIIRSRSDCRSSEEHQWFLGETRRELPLCAAYVTMVRTNWEFPNGVGCKQVMLAKTFSVALHFERFTNSVKSSLCKYCLPSDFPTPRFCWALLYEEKRPNTITGKNMLDEKTLAVLSLLSLTLRRLLIRVDFIIGVMPACEA